MSASEMFGSEPAGGSATTPKTACVGPRCGAADDHDLRCGRTEVCTSPDGFDHSGCI